MYYSFNDTSAALSEVLTTYRWRLDFNKLPSGEGVKALDTNILIRCTSSNIPGAQMGTVGVDLQGHHLTFAGKTTKSGSITLNFVEGTDLLVFNFFKSWENACWHADGQDTYGTQSLTSNLRAEIVLTMGAQQTATSGGDRDLMTCTLLNCLPSWSHNIDLGQDPGSGQSWSITINYDDFHINTTSTPTGGSW